jgi:hypothetical protein
MKADKFNCFILEMTIDIVQLFIIQSLSGDAMHRVPTYKIPTYKIPTYKIPT